jgi:large repetitive protein
VSVRDLEPGATWQFSLDGGMVWRAGSGQSFDLTASDLEAGATFAAGQVLVRQTDAAGHSATAGNTEPWVLDTTIAAPALGLALDSGTKATDGLTRSGSLHVSGSMESGAVIQYRIRKDAGSFGAWLDSYTAPSTDGAYQVQVRQVDLAGNVSDSRSLSFTLDTQTASPQIALIEDSGTGARDGITRLSTAFVSNLEAGARWAYQVDGGEWVEGVRLTPDALESSMFTATIKGGYVSRAGAATVRPMVNAGDGKKTAWFLLADDGYTKGVQVEFSRSDAGRLQVKAVKAGYVRGLHLTDWETQTLQPQSLASSDASPGYGLHSLKIKGVQTGGGTYLSTSVSDAPDAFIDLIEGTHAYKLRQIDAAGNEGVSDSPVSYTVDRDMARPELVLMADTGAARLDGITQLGSIRVANLEAGATWAYQVDGAGAWIDGSGSSFRAHAGAHSYVVRQSDAAGNTAFSTPVAYVLDLTAPAQPAGLGSGHYTLADAKNGVAMPVFATVSPVSADAGVASVTVQVSGASDQPRPVNVVDVSQFRTPTLVLDSSVGSQNGEILLSVRAYGFEAGQSISALSRRLVLDQELVEFLGLGGTGLPGVDVQTRVEDGQCSSTCSGPRRTVTTRRRWSTTAPC